MEDFKQKFRYTRILMALFYRQSVLSYFCFIFYAFLINYDVVSHEDSLGVQMFNV